MGYEVKVEAEGSEVFVGVKRAECESQPCAYAKLTACKQCLFGRYHLVAEVSPPSLVARLFGSTFATEVARAIKSAEKLKARLERRDEQARLAAEVATRVAESAKDHRIHPEHPWPPPPPPKNEVLLGYQPDHGLPKDAKPPNEGKSGLVYPAAHEVSPGEPVDPATIDYGSSSPPVRWSDFAKRYVAATDATVGNSESVASSTGPLPELCYSWLGCDKWVDREDGCPWLRGSGRCHWGPPNSVCASAGKDLNCSRRTREETQSPKVTPLPPYAKPLPLEIIQQGGPGGTPRTRRRK